MMNRKIFISKKMYVAPLIAFEELEEEQELLAGSVVIGGGPTQNNGDNTSTTDSIDVNPILPAKAGGVFDDDPSQDFIFEMDE